jgi:hypothetical protein
MFASKAGACLSGVLLWGMLRALPVNIRVCLGKTLKLFDIGKLQKYQVKFYRTFYIHNLRIFVISWRFVLGRTFQPSLMFVSKAYPRMCSTFQMPHCRVGSCTNPQTYDKARKACQGQTLLLFSIIVALCSSFTPSN